MNGTSLLTSGSPGWVPNDWQIVGVGDFGGDGKADILWRHSWGLVDIWVMSGVNVGSAGTLGYLPPSWMIQ
jgi:hypothetical protein